MPTTRSTNPTLLILSAIASLLFCSTASAQSSVCKWQDEKGKWHISAVPPDASIQCGKARANSLETVPREDPSELKDRSKMSLGEAFVQTQRRQKELEKKYIAGTASPAEIREYELRKERIKEANAQMELTRQEAQRRLEKASPQEPLKCKKTINPLYEYECTK